jgi:glycosyltransferase involved in cell wall biosynthesis
MSRELVSVIIPVYNGEAFVAQAIESVLAQSHGRLELILVDDGSTDGSADICQTYVRQDQRVSYVHQENRGVAGARNSGIARSSGPLVAFLDCDDAWLPDKLAKQIPLFGDEAVGLVYTSLFLKNGDKITDATPHKTFCQGDCFSAILKYNFIPNSTVVTRRSLLETAGPFDERRELIGVEDKLMWLKIAKLARVALVKEPLMIYNYQGERVSTNQQAMLTGELLCLEEIARLHPPSSERERLDFSQAHSEVYRHYGHNFFTIGNFAKARDCYGKSLKTGGFKLKSLLYYGAALLPPGLISAARSLKGRVGSP